MSRLDYITILIVIVGIVALSYLIYKIYQNNSAQNSRISRVEETYDPNQSTDDETATYPSEDDYNNSITPQDEEYYDEDGSGYQESTQETDPLTQEDYDNTTTTAENETFDETQRNNSFDNSSSTASSYGDYMVIAGTFTIKQNAENQVKKLKDLGYPNASMHIFDRGAYAVVIVDRFDDYNSANRLKNELVNDRNVEAIVQKKQ